jgi:hypothetical protein
MRSLALLLLLSVGLTAVLAAPASSIPAVSLDDAHGLVAKPHRGRLRSRQLAAKVILFEDAVWEDGKGDVEMGARAKDEVSLEPGKVFFKELTSFQLVP